MLQVLVSTMFQKDYTLLERMNISTAAIIVNQTDSNSYEEFAFRGNTIIWINISQRGLSKSRNTALSYADKDVCLFADDDMVFVDNYQEIIEKEFFSIPEADIIAFDFQSINMSNARRTTTNKDRRSPKNKYYCSVQLAIKTVKIKKYSISYNELIGAGTAFSSGEESVFLRDCRNKKLNIYESSKVIGTVDFSTSTWFNGFNEKYFYNKGPFLYLAYNSFASIVALYYVIQAFKLPSLLSPLAVYKTILKGISDFKEI